ncbi:glycosyltransferase [Hwangdonia lutea]|uniref:Glycosyltransferase n=1 Tax=Hwangdonia lutea TaxID=3075823 RepID=A0AA97EPG2_9FLAO|nr:glycosyltransferase [Hwangdonia sp. SCSIO 19198]WOD45149.1 glycosyltransferase [Hwangdonia sp. SCSIO 19198]
MKKRILVAPLNWGLGHATRCIPIIKALITCGFEPILASDGDALLLLQKEFPDLIAIALPAYHITYAKKKQHFKLKLLKDAPKLIKTIKAEKKVTAQIVESHQISGIISDNRWGVYNDKIPSVFVTHQLNVLSGNTTWLSTKMHQKLIQKFDACWIPDTAETINLSGKLGHADAFKFSKKYIGPLSRFEKQNVPMANAILVLLSGPEPQRSLLEKQLFKAFKNFDKNIVFVKGVIEKEQTVQVMGNMSIYNFMTSELLEKTINESALVIARSGYTTIMDLSKLDKKAFFIPTPGQFEQEYLAKRLTDLNLVPSCNQEDFKIDKLKSVEDFKGLKTLNYNTDFKDLFSLFERE